VTEEVEIEVDYQRMSRLRYFFGMRQAAENRDLSLFGFRLCLPEDARD